MTGWGIAILNANQNRIAFQLISCYCGKFERGNAVSGRANKNDLFDKNNKNYANIFTL